MGERSDDALSGVPAGGLKPSTEASVKEQMRKEVRCCLQRWCVWQAIPYRGTFWGRERHRVAYGRRQLPAAAAAGKG